jgi:hypothetical protein
MPYPDKYTRQYDFQSYQNSNPARPLPADKVNADLNFVQSSIGEIVDFLKKSIRADGKLANGSVGREQLADSVAIGFNAPQEWATAVIYTAGISTVFYGGSFYTAAVTHTSSGTFDVTKWNLVTDFDALATQIAMTTIATDPNMSALSGLSGAADKFAYFTGAGAMALTPVTAATRSFLGSSSVAAMRTALVLDGRTTVGDTAKTIAATDKVVATTTVFTAPRVWKLPAASAFNPGQSLQIDDSLGAVSTANTLTLALTGSDAFAPGSATTFVISQAGNQYRLVSDGVSKWVIEYVSADNVVYNMGLAGSTNRLLASMFHNEIWLEDFGADPTGVTSSESAINNWLAQAGSGKSLRFGPGNFTFSTAKTLAVMDRFSIVGAGRDVSNLTYIGANTTNDIITFGTNVTTSKNCTFSDFTVASTTTMTGGYAFRLKGLSNSIVSRVSMAGQNGNGNLWHGIYFDAVQICRYEDYETLCQRDGASVSGTVGFGPKALMHFKEGWMLGTSYTDSVGIRIGGAFGGVYVDAVDVSGIMFAACVVDETLKAEWNREIFFWNADFDAGHTYSVLVQHSAGNPGVYAYDGCYFFSPVRLQSGNNTGHKFTGCSFSPNLGGDALRVDDTMLVFVDGAFLINSPNGYGFNGTVAHNVYFGDVLSSGNALGSYNPAHPPKYLSRTYGFSAHKNGTAQTGINMTATKVTFGTEVYDTGGFYDATSSKWTPPAGPITIKAGMVYTTNVVVGSFGSLSIYKNGTIFKQGLVFGAFAAGFMNGEVTIDDVANGTDYYEVYTSGGTASNFAIDGVAANTWFMGTVR